MASPSINFSMTERLSDIKCQSLLDEETSFQMSPITQNSFESLSNPVFRAILVDPWFAPTEEVLDFWLESFHGVYHVVTHHILESFLTLCTLKTGLKRQREFSLLQPDLKTKQREDCLAQDYFYYFS